MSYKITKLTAGNPISIDIDEVEYFDIKETRYFLLNTLYLEEKFDFVIGNYLEFEEELLKIGARHMVLPREPIEKVHRERRLINRRIANLLTVCKLYIHQSKHHISNIYGSDSDQFKTIDDEQSIQYDSLLGYRVMEAMRNHVQHRGYPIHTTKYSMDRVEDQLLYTFNPHIKIKYLEDDPKFKNSVLEEMKGLGEELDIKPFIREYIEGLGIVQSKIREMIEHDLEIWDKKLTSIEDRYKDESGDEISLAGLAIISLDESDKIKERAFITTKIIDRRKNLSKRNRGLSNLLRRYVSNEIKT